jgi:predicted ester cyclase
VRNLVQWLALAAAFVGGATSAHADDRKVVESFYAKLLNAGGSADLEADAKAILADNWVSIGDYSGKAKDRATFAKQVAGFAKLMPDMAWKVEEVLQSDNRVIVRGRAKGTPIGPLFGVEPSGRSFEIMSLDVHTLEGGKIVQTYHVEDWAGALAQLRSK